MGWIRFWKRHLIIDDRTEDQSNDDPPQSDDEDPVAMNDLRSILTYEMSEDYRGIRAVRFGDVLQAGPEPWT